MEIRKILVVDDRDENRSLLKRILIKEGRDIATAETLEAAISMIRIENYHLVISDWFLTLEMSDDITAARILEFLRTNGIRTPVIVITSYYAPSIGRKAKSLGACDYIHRNDLQVDYVKRIQKRAARILED